jgi:hypothetical protein
MFNDRLDHVVAWFLGLDVGICVMIIWMFFALITKHFIFDFLLQGSYQYKNKGTYGHPGGLLHSGLQGLGTFLAFIYFVSPIQGIILATLDASIHYHIDWAKMNINTRFGLKPDNSEKFWWLLGLDQYLHYLTYLGLIVLVTYTI